MTQQTSPFLEGKFGWVLGESNWNLGMDENLLKFSYMFDRNIDGIVSSLPAVVNGTAYFNTTDNRIYFAVGGSYTSTPTPKWFIVTLRSSGIQYQFNGTTLTSDIMDVPSSTDLASQTGSSSIGWKRSGLTDNITTVAQQLNTTPVSIWEFADLVTSKPTLGDPSTWDWTPALVALSAHTSPLKVVPPTPAVSTYISGAFTVRSGSKWFLRGIGIQAISTLSSGTPLVINATTSGAVDTYPDQNIEFFGGTFYGNAGARTNALLAFLKVYNFRMWGTRVTGNQYQGIAFGGCKNVVLDSCEVDLNGNPTVTAEGGSAIWLGATGGSETYDVTLSNVHAHHNEWSVLYGNATRVNIINPNWHDNKESSAFFNSTAKDIQFIGGTIRNVTRKNISASGIEFGGDGLTVDGTVIDTCDNNAIALTDAKNVDILAGTKTRNCRRDATTFPSASHVDIISLTAATGQPQKINIIGHDAYDASLPAIAAVSIVGQAPGAAPINIRVEGGNYSTTSWTSGDSVRVQTTSPDLRSVSQIIRNNAGTDGVVEFGGYAAARYYAGEGVTPAAVGTLALVANTLYATAAVFRKTTLWTKIAVNVTVAAAAGKSVRLGIYALKNGVPVGVVFDAGAILADTTGVKEITISRVLPAGMYALTVISDGTPTITAGSMAANFAGTIGASGFGVSDQLMISSVTFGALPTTFGTVTYTTGVCPVITMRTGI